MSTITAEEARGKFSDIINKAAYGKERTIVTRHGKNVAAIVSMDDLELLEKLLRAYEDRIDAEACRNGMEEVEREGTLSIEELRSELGL